MSVLAGVSGRRRRDRPEGAAGLEADRERTRKTWLLAVCCVAQFMVILDLSIVNVALPSIQSSLDFSAIQLQWVVDAYAILFAGFLMLGGRATDFFGQRRAFVAALGFFAAASLAGGLAVDKNMLIVARGAQGLAGALMAAASLAIITSSFEGAERHRAIGLWGAMNGAGGAAGTLFGGIITQEVGWRWVLLINPPIGLVAALVAAAVVVDRRREGARAGFDISGALSLTGGLIVLVYGIVEAGALGIGDPAAWAPIVVGALLLAAFPVIETRLAAQPLVPMRALTGPLRVANGVVLLFSAAIFPMWYLSSLYLQQVLGLSPLAAGAVFLPMTLAIMAAAARAAWLVNRFGLRAVLGSGLAMMTGGMLLFGRIASSGTAVGYVMVPGLLMAAGIGLAVVASTIAATQGAGSDQAGLASGLVNTSRQVGGALGIALLITIASQVTSGQIGTGHPAPEALTNGFRVAYLIGGAFVALAGVLTLARLAPPGGRRPPLRARLVMPVAAVVLVGGFVGINLATTASAVAPIGAYSLANTEHFVSAPNLHPPKIAAVGPEKTAQLAPGTFALANFYDLTTHPMDGQSGPLLLDRSLQPVWFKPVPTTMVASNLEAQTYEGKPVLSWWQGVVTNTGAMESGEDVVVNQHYQVVATLKGANGWILTLHAMKIVGHDAWVTANKDMPMDLAHYGGAKSGAITDSAVQEYDLRTGKLVYSWDALAHIPLSASYAIPPTNGFPWDAYHVNAISLAGPHHLLVSMRNTWAAYKIDTQTGKIAWILGGKQSSFSFGPGADFEWQHDVQLGPTGEVTLFDDHCCQISGAGTYLAPTGPSRGLVLRVDTATHRASVVTQYRHGKSFDAAYMGDLQLLPNGNALVGWGAQPYFSEYSPTGKLLLDAKLPGPDLTYRTELVHWVGKPLTRPSAALRRGAAGTRLYVSWNGATQVARWRLLAGPSRSGLTAVTTRARTGFETALAVPRGEAVVEAQALDAAGAVIASSRPLRVRS